MPDPGQVEMADMPGQRVPGQRRSCGRDETVDDQSGFPGSRRARHGAQPTNRENDADVVQVVELLDLDGDLIRRARAPARGP
jgi:hypothetical protein